MQASCIATIMAILAIRTVHTYKAGSVFAVTCWLNCPHAYVCTQCMVQDAKIMPIHEQVLDA